MRLVTFSVYGDARLGAVEQDAVVDLARACARYSGEGTARLFSDMRTFLASGQLAATLGAELIAAALEENIATPSMDNASLLRKNDVKLLAPILNPQKIYCPAVNYVAHGKEAGIKPPSVPYIFTKFANALVGQEASVIYPKDVKRMDMEAELAVIVGTRGKDFSPSEAFTHVAGYTCLNDVSFRDLQNEPGWPKVMNPYGQNWVKGKGLDTACPLGPWLVTKDEIGEPYPLKILGRQNGKVIQRGTTSEMVHKVQELLSYLSQGVTLEPGDVVATGVPARVPENERAYLAIGDTIEVEIEKIGVLRNHVVAE